MRHTSSHFTGNRCHSNETMEDPVHELDTGMVFAGRYQIIEEMGKGRMGKVCKALDLETKKRLP